jgi:hypothetical protein
MEEQLAGAFELYSQLFAEKLKQALTQTYPYAPGFDGSAYNNGRNPQYRGAANKIAGVPEGYNTNLINSVEATYNVGSQEVQVFMNDYWQYVNDGRRPGKGVPIRPLMLWAMDRLGLNQQEAKSMAFGVSQNIKKFGIQPTYFFDIAIEQLSAQIDQDLFNELGASIDDFISQTIINAIPANNELNIRTI